MAFKGERKTTTTVKVAAAQGSEASVDSIQWYDGLGRL